MVNASLYEPEIGAAVDVIGGPTAFDAKRSRHRM